MLIRLQTALRRRFDRAARGAEDGFTLIEVVVAMFVFMIVSLAILSSILLTKTTSSNAEARQTATNLATAAINVARTTTDLNDLTSSTTSQTVAGKLYTVTTTARWAPSTAGATTQCATGTTGAVLGKSVEVEVSWQGAGTTTPVNETTMVASQSAVTQVGNGSVMVQVTNAAGQPLTAGTAVSITAAGDGAQAPVGTVPSTIDAQGCAFMPNLVPGTYTVVLGTTYSGSGDPYVDTTGAPQSSQTVSVTANTMSLADFTYDQSAPVAVTFGPSGAIVPSGIQASFEHEGTISVPAGGCLGVAADYCVFPYRDGYSIVAGNLGAGTAPACMSVDPTQWQASSGYAQGTATAVATKAGTPVTVAVPMGTVSLTGLSALIPAGSGASLTITAQQQSVGDGTADPGCAVPSSYSFPNVTSATPTLALPYGTWVLTYSTGTAYTVSCTSRSSGSGATCNASGSSSPSGYSPLPANGSTIPSGATVTGSSKSGSTTTYTWSWSATTTTTTGGSLASNIVAPAAPSAYTDGEVTLDPRTAATPTASPSDTSTPTDTPTGTSTPGATS